MIRIARIEVDPAQVEAYRTAVKEIGEASLTYEPGVLMLFSVVDKLHPNRFTVFEIYGDTLAYQAHIKTAHFRKYKESTKSMVKSLELIDVDVVYPGLKSGLSAGSMGTKLWKGFK